MQGDITAALRDMLGVGVGIGVTDPREALDDLWAEERADAAQMIPRRRYEFAAGRRAARSAMAALGLPAIAVPVGTQREPLWPGALTGSIAHCQTHCIAAVSATHRSIGIDIEPDMPLPDDLIDIICGPDERADPKRVFCAKEAVYKAQYPLTSQVIGFDAVKISLQSDNRFSAQLPDRHLQGIVKPVGRFIIATCVIA